MAQRFARRSRASTPGADFDARPSEDLCYNRQRHGMMGMSAAGRSLPERISRFYHLEYHKPSFLHPDRRTYLDIPRFNDSEHLSPKLSERSDPDCTLLPRFPNSQPHVDQAHGGAPERASNTIPGRQQTFASTQGPSLMAIALDVGWLPKERRCCSTQRQHQLPWKAGTSGRTPRPTCAQSLPRLLDNFRGEGQPRPATPTKPMTCHTG